MDTQTRPRVSVAMAAYNGERYIARQVESILSQLDKDDELVISVDPSADRTMQVAQEFAACYACVRVLNGPGQGVVRNFENALTHALGEVIFLSDQDDVWRSGKLRACIDALREERVSAVVHDAVIADEDLNELQSSYFSGGFYSGIWRNVLRNRYIGCCMAFRREVLKAALPFPPNIPMHDQWLGITARRMGNVVYIDKALVLYRRHHQTVTGRGKAGMVARLKWRLGIVLALFKLPGRIKAAVPGDRDSADRV